MSTEGSANENRPRVSAVVCLFSEGRTLLGFRKASDGRPAVGWQWPGGKVDAGELVEDAACRELREETGIVLEPWELKFVAVVQHTNAIGSWVLHLFVHEMKVEASDSWPARNNEPDKFEGWKWMSWSTLKKHAVNHEAGNAELWSWRMHDVLRHIALNADRPREKRIPGYQTHCFCCLRRIPCACMGVVG